jgi:glycosyltransferase involved in cell wall biosynthesis
MLGDLPMLKEYLPEWRARVSQLLDCCDAFVTTAESVREIHLSAFPQLSNKPFWIIEHGRDFNPVASVATPPRLGEPVRILAAGNIDHHKGSLFIRQLKELDTDGLLEFHFLGKTDVEIHHIGVHHGPYRREDFARLARKFGPRLPLFSIWAETYSYTLTEAWSVGLPVLGSKLGAVGERIARHGGGWRIETTNPAAALAQIREIVTHPTAYQDELQAVARIQIQTVEEMADAYRALYDHISANGKRGPSRHIGCIVPKGDRGSTFIRVGLPFTHEEMKQRVLSARLPARLTTTSEIDSWIDRLRLQMILVQREALNQEAVIPVVEMCRAKGVRVVFEIDDNLLELERSHADFEFVKAKVDAIGYLAKAADQVIVSTPNLQKVFLPFNERALVVGNALDEWLWFSPEPAAVHLTPPHTIVAGYMGTMTHQEDLEMIREPFLNARERLLRERGIRLILQLVGGISEDNSAPWYERLEVPKGHTSYPRFVRWLRRTVAWDFGLAPLVACPFNEAKSALKFLEYAALGVPGIFSHVGEYPEVIEDRRTGLLADSGHPEKWEE